MATLTRRASSSPACSSASSRKTAYVLGKWRDFHGTDAPAGAQAQIRCSRCTGVARLLGSSRAGLQVRLTPHPTIHLGLRLTVISPPRQPDVLGTARSPGGMVWLPLLFDGRAVLILLSKPIPLLPACLVYNNAFLCFHHPYLPLFMFPSSPRLTWPHMGNRSFY